jgi:hypothetical protein
MWKSDGHEKRSGNEPGANKHLSAHRAGAHELFPRFSVESGEPRYIVRANQDSDISQSPVLHPKSASPLTSSRDRP